MNFQIKKSKSKQQISQKDVNDHLQFGLNVRDPKKSENKKKKSIFQANDSSSSSSSDEGDGLNNKGRSGVNRTLRKEQNLVRTNVLMSNSTKNNNDNTLYDYDAEYESFTTNKKDSKEDTTKKKEEKKKESQYISNLLKTAEKRQMEQEIIYERQIAKEQSIEDTNEEYINKEKFITSAYKRKLEERNVWEQKDKQKSEKEKLEDVTKKGSDGSAFIGFYGNMQRQKELGCNNDDDGIEKKDDLLTKRNIENDVNNTMNHNISMNPKGSSAGNTSEYSQKRIVQKNHMDNSSTATTANDQEVEDKNKRIISRKEKLYAARIRYFERHPDLVDNEQ